MKKMLIKDKLIWTLKNTVQTTRMLKFLSRECEKS